MMQPRVINAKRKVPGSHHLGDAGDNSLAWEQADRGSDRIQRRLMSIVQSEGIASIGC